MTHAYQLIKLGQYTVLCSPYFIIYVVQNCNDGIQNGYEEGVDCGESAGCEPCPSCFDGIQNGDEEGVDCGGTGGCSICGKNFMNE